MLVKKVTAAQAAGDTLDFVLSDATVDRYGDVIDPKGWLLQHFQANPIALFNHDSDFPIGTWQDVRVAGGQLVGRLALAAASTSPRIAELVSLVAQGVLRAVSVGFQPLASEPRDKSGSGMLFTRQELLECSLVSVPANPSALQIAKRLQVSDDTIRMAFGEQADQGRAVVRRSATGETVRPGGSIVALFDLGTDCLSWILDQLKAAAPVLSGEYRASIAIYADGIAVDTPAAASAAGEVAFVSTVPYARKIERGESPKAPHGVFQAVAALAAARYGNVARIRYAFREPVGGATALEAWASIRSARDAGRQQRQQYLKDVRQPAVVVTSRDRS